MKLLENCFRILHISQSYCWISYSIWSHFQWLPLRTGCWRPLHCLCYLQYTASALMGPSEYSWPSGVGGCSLTAASQVSVSCQYSTPLLGQGHFWYKIMEHNHYFEDWIFTLDDFNLLNKISLSINLLILNPSTFVLNTNRGVIKLETRDYFITCTFTLTKKAVADRPVENNTSISNFNTNIYICSILRT